MSTGVSVVILCEDEQHAFFARYFLRCKGWDSKNFRVEKGIRGKGSGEQFVRENLPVELKKMRQFRREARALIIVTDADNYTVDERLGFLRNECTNQGVEPWSDDEPVFILIPRWEIQNWLAYLSGDRLVGEGQSNYGADRDPSSWRDGVQKLAKMCDLGKLEDTPPESLVRACGEYKRFREMVRR